MTFFTNLLSLIGQSTERSGAGTPGRGAEHRRALRRPQRMREGFIWCPAKPAFPPQPCRIKDISSTGARVETIDALPQPAQWSSGVRLYFATENHEIDCHMAWRNGRSMGLRFQSAPLPPSRQYR